MAPSTASQILRHLGDALLLHETSDDYAPLIAPAGRPPTKKQGTALDIFSALAGSAAAPSNSRFPAARRAIDPRWRSRPSAAATRGEGNAAPFKPRQIGQSLLEHLGRYVFGLGAARHLACHIGIDTREVALV